MAGAAAFGVMGTAIIGVNAAIKVFKALELATLFTGPAGVLLGVAAGIAGVTAAVVGFVEATRDGGPAVRELTEAARELNEAIEEAGATCEDTTASTLAAADRSFRRKAARDRSRIWLTALEMVASSPAADSVNRISFFFSSSADSRIFTAWSAILSKSPISFSSLAASRLSAAPICLALKVTR